MPTMTGSKRERYEAELRKLEKADIPESDKELIRENADAHDPQTASVTNPDRGTVSDSTLCHYVSFMRRMAELSDFKLSGATAEDVNGYMDRLLSGGIEDVKDSGLTPGTVNNHQGVARVFFDYHDHLGVKKQDIALISDNDANGVDERDIFNKEEIQAIRNAASHARDKALVDMLLYTGQRLSAILNLRRKDIDLDDATFYLNEERGDLKGASGKRPLLYAEKAVRQWYNEHPCDDPGAFFITHKYNWENKPYEPGQRLDNSSIYRQLQRIGDKAGVDKPMNAHNFRHTFVTVSKRDYEMDNDTIKRLIGHRPDSDIMETTYSHLTDDDVIAQARSDAGIEEKDEESPLTPDICENCGEPVPMENAKACPSCGIAFTPDARSAQDKIQADADEKRENTDDIDLLKAVDKIKRIQDENPELLEQLDL